METAISEAPLLSAQLIRLGFTVRETGGGCTAWEKDCGEFLLVVTDADSPDTPADHLPTRFTVMVPEHSDPIAETVHPTGADLARLLADQP